MGGNCRMFDIYHFAYLGIFDIMILAFCLFKNGELWLKMSFSIAFNARLHTNLLHIFGCLGFIVSVILNAFPDLDGFNALIYVHLIALLLAASGGKIGNYIRLLYFVSAASLLISLVAASDQFVSALSESLELFKDYYMPGESFYSMRIGKFKSIY